MNKRILIVSAVSAVLTLFALLSGCGGKGGDAPEDTTSLVYWSMWNETEPQAMVLKEAIADFESANPGTEVSVQWNGRDILKILQPALDAGTAIDLWDHSLDMVIQNWREYSLRLDDYYTRSFPSTGGKSFADTVMQAFQTRQRELTPDQGLYAVPYQPYVVAVFYNREHFEQAGISETPDSWSEFIEVCAKLKDSGFTPLTIDDAYIELPLGTHLARMFGNSEDVEALITEGGARWDDERVLQAARDFQMLSDGGYISPQVAANKWPAGQQEVAAGEVSMYFLNGTWLPNEVMATAGEDFPWGQFAYPGVTGGVNDSAATFSAQAFQINKDTSAPDAAFALTVHITSGEWDEAMSSRTFGVPMASGAAWPVQLADSETIFRNIDGYMPWAANLSANPDALPVVKAAFTNLLAGGLSAEGFIAEVKANL